MINKFYSILTILFKRILARIPSRRSESYDLVIVRVDLLGDFIMRYDSLVEVQNFYKGKRVLLICPHMVMPFVENNFNFTRIIGYDFKKLDNWAYVLSLYKLLKSIKSEEIFYSAWQRYPQGDTIVSFIKGRRIAGMKSTHDLSRSKVYNERLYTELYELPKGKSEIEAIELFVKKAFNPTYQYGHNPLVVDSSISPIVKKPYIVLSLSASMEEKTWAISSFIELIMKIPDKYTIVLSGAGRNDKEKAQKILISVASRGGIVNLVNCTSVLELASLISQADLVIGNDSAAVHIAAATRVPSVCVLHGAQYGRILPYPEHLYDNRFHPKSVFYKMDCFYCDYHCKYKERAPFRCLSSVTVEMVFSVVSDILNL